LQIIRGSYNLRPQHRGCVATIGNFDGVHRGHRAVLAGLLRRAAEHNLPACVITFEPLPNEYFQPDESPARLCRLREKLALLHEAGIQRVLLLRFNAKLASQSPQEFIREVLVDGLAVKHLVVGDDFHFGACRAGNYAALVAAGNEHGFSVEPTKTYSMAASRVSSTRIRECLDSGDLEAAAELLGRPYRMEGRVKPGEQFGRQLGFRTANIAIRRLRAPLAGVFAVRVREACGAAHEGMANLGVRPTVNGLLRPLLETHLFDFDGNLYGQHLCVEFVHKLRDEQKFDSLDALKAALANDEHSARAFFAAQTA
jgi:riboflavin kinase/FMN adenylyltransferase